MNELILDVDSFLQTKAAFAGGFVHANAHYVQQVIPNVSSFDLTSSYPSVMLLEKFPMSAPILIKDTLDYSTLTELIKYKAVLMDVTFKNIVPRLYQDHPISYSHCRNIKNYTLDNGRVVTAEQLTTTITEQDFITILSFYDWDECSFSNVRIFDKQYLPKGMAKTIIELYKSKTTLKGVDGKEIEYLVSKGMLNSLFGMSVTNPCRDELGYDSENDTYTSSPVNYKTAIEKYNNSKTRFLYYPWGIWVTAYARRNLFKAIESLGNDYIYADTDSVKFLNREKHIQFFENYNKEILDKIEKSAKFYNFNIEDYSPVNIKGKVCTIGLWDDEGTYSKFKTLGAKRYFVLKDDKYSLTMAGANKKKAAEYLAKQEDPFAAFDFGLVIPEEYSGRLTSTYIDDETSGYVTDYLGNTYKFKELSAIHMEPSQYELDKNQDFIDYIMGVRMSALM